MFTHLSFGCAKKISLHSIDIDAFKNMRDGRSLDLGICAIYRVPLRDSDQYLYIDSLDSTATVSHSLADWMDRCWDGGSKNYACGDF